MKKIELSILEVQALVFALTRAIEKFEAIENRYPQPTNVKGFYQLHSGCASILKKVGYED